MARAYVTDLETIREDHGLLDNSFKILCFGHTSFRSMLEGLYLTLVICTTLGSLLEQIVVALLSALIAQKWSTSLQNLTAPMAHRRLAVWLIIFVPLAIRLGFLLLARLRNKKGPPMSFVGYFILSLGCGYVWGIPYGSLMTLVPVLIGDVVTFFVFLPKAWERNSNLIGNYVPRIINTKLASFLFCLTGFTAIPGDATLPIMAMTENPVFGVGIIILTQAKLFFPVIIGDLIYRKLYDTNSFVGLTRAFALFLSVMTTLALLIAFIALVDYLDSIPQDEGHLPRRRRRRRASRMKSSLSKDRFGNVEMSIIPSSPSSPSFPSEGAPFVGGISQSDEAESSAMAQMRHGLYDMD